MAQTINSTDEEGKVKVLFKTIMCPLGDSCTKVKKARWPSSSIKAVTQFGANCPYAHHFNELVFPETLNTKIAVTKHLIKNISSEAATDAKKRPFVPAGIIQKKHTKHIEKRDMDEKTKKLRAICEKQQDESLTSYIAEMKEIKA